MTLLELIASDFAQAHRRALPDGAGQQVVMVVVLLPKMKSLATALYRVAHALGSRSPVLAGLVKQLNQLITGADVAYEARFGPALAMLHPVGVVVAPGVIGGSRCTIHQGVTLGGKPEGAPTLGDDVNIAPGARIIGPISIGNNVHVGANAVVTHDFGDDVILVGVPAEVLRGR